MADGYYWKQSCQGCYISNKSSGAQYGFKVIDRAIPMHGAAGTSQDFPLALWTSQRTLRLADGPDEVHRRVIARKELAKYK